MDIPCGPDAGTVTRFVNINMMQPMPGKIIVKQDGHAGPKTIKREDGTHVRLELSEKFKEKDRPQTGRVLAVGVGKPCELSDIEVREKISGVFASRCTCKQMRQEDPSWTGACHGCQYEANWPDDARGKRIDAILHAFKGMREIERQSRPVSVKAGDLVVFRVFAGDGIEWTDGSMCRCLTEDDLLAVILE